MFLLIDGKHFVYRAFYSMPELTRATDSFPVGAIHGWCRIIWRLMDEYKAAGNYEVFWDAGIKARADLDSDYKANRKATPEPLKLQLPYIERLVNAMGMTSWKEPGSEADDLIASRARSLSSEGHETLIVSADKDFAQCVSDVSPAGQGCIHMLVPPPTAGEGSWKRLDAVGVLEKFGVTPEQIADYLALMGDTSDNVKGLEGVGPKTAGEWLKSYKTLEGVIENCGRLNPKRFQNVVYENAEKLRKNRELTTLHDRTLSDAIRTEGRLDGAAVIAILEELQLKSCREEAARRYAAKV